MILPYFATVLLVVATAYAAVVSFKQKSDSGGTLIFPNGVKKSARMFVGVATLILVIGLVAWLNVAARKATRPTSRFLIPDGYTGWVRVEFEVQGAPPLPMDAGQNVLTIPPSGLLQTSSAEQYGWAKDSYYFSSNAGARPIPDSGAQALIWGKINGEKSGSSGKRKYQQFFVGTEQQFREQAGDKGIAPKPLAH
jgi:hypothetical protein